MWLQRLKYLLFSPIIFFNGGNSFYCISLSPDYTLLRGGRVEDGKLTSNYGIEISVV